MAVARPSALIVAMPVAEELHVAEGRGRMLPFPKVRVAENYKVAARAIEGFAGVIAMEANLLAEEPGMREHANMNIAAAVATKGRKVRIAQARTFRDTTPQSVVGVEDKTPLFTRRRLFRCFQVASHFLSMVDSILLR